MSQDELRESLAALRSELDRLEAEEDQVRQRLDALSVAIAAHVDDPGSAERHHSIIQDLRQSVLELEASHPQATAILSRITAALGNVGS